MSSIKVIFQKLPASELDFQSKLKNVSQSAASAAMDQVPLVLSHSCKIRSSLFSAKIFFGQRIFRLNFWKKYFLVENLIFEQKNIFGRKNHYWGKKIFFWPKKSFLSKKIFFGRKNHFWAKKYFLAEKIIGRKDLWPKKVLAESWIDRKIPWNFNP